eukprot:TRINITY_DN2948_c0_g1_i12.p1 TRINITY_DN2948_c0_g1~~TRINITY_DN2948_c0_g1_i12.p1  ORF type:complete len:404 (+),score=67.93 TRINITY_DN2948_c0_g1_i12:173-1384(+)
MNRFFIVSIWLTLIAAKTNLRASSSSSFATPDYDKSVSEYIRSYGYPFEEHHATTQDGYILTLWRIPCRNSTNDKCIPVYLQHGLLDTAFSFLYQSIEENLPIKLYNEGYDIWLGNVRGSRYSLGHTHLDSGNQHGPYWYFSYDEMAKYDLPAMLAYVKSITRAPKVKYICHSQGCALITALGALDPEFLGSMVNTTVALAPAVYLQFQSSITFILAEWANLINVYLKVGLNAFLVGKEWHEAIKLTGYLFPEFFMHTLYALAGPVNKPSMPIDRVPVLAAHLPGGTSSFNMIHFVQASKSKVFKQLDFGREGNLEHYGTAEAPAYNMTNWQRIAMKWRIVYGDRDAFVPKQSIVELMKHVSTGHNVELQAVADASHLDLHCATYASTVVFPQVIEFLKRSDG